MKNTLFPERRKSYMETGEIFFWTATINSWYKLLYEDRFKNVIVNSLQYLSDMALMDVFSFVIMPTHVHFIWRAIAHDRRESAQGSFLKYTAHEFRKLLLREDEAQLIPYRVKAHNKKHEFWQRDPLAIHLYTRKVALQKLNYIHRNPIAKGWKLASDMFDYYYSSASYYERGERRFAFLKDLRDEF